ncbi:MAG: DUF58 domain-containing protein [Pseudomonadota bacterium]
MRPEPLNPRTHPERRMHRLRDAAIRWITRRHPQDQDHARLGRDRVYILPTRAGYTLFGVILVMLLGSINYSNNMAFLLTFLLAGIGHNAIWYTHRNLLGLQVSSLPVVPAFAGQPLEIGLHLADTAGRAREALHWGVGNYTSAPVAVAAHAGTPAPLRLPGVARGVYHLPRQRIATRYPLGILEAWSWTRLATEIVVYPAPLDPGLRENAPGATAANEDREQPGESPDHIRPYRPGDPPGRIVWKALARSGKLHVRESRGGAPDRVWLDWDSLPNADTETRLSMLCHQVLKAHAEGRVYGMRLPGQTLEPGQGPEHRERCLQTLARYQVTPTLLPLTTPPAPGAPA